MDCYEYQFTWFYFVDDSLNEILKHCTSKFQTAALDSLETETFTKDASRFGAS